MSETNRRIVPVVLAGGSGTRLWPLSRPDAPKQFMRLTGRRSLFQHAVLRGQASSGDESPIVVAGTRYRVRIEKELAEIGVQQRLLIEEPEGRNTAPAILAAARELDPEDIMLVLSADQWIPDVEGFGEFVAHIGAQHGTALATLSVRPRYAATQFGYIELGDARPNGHGYYTHRFVEKPDAETASQYYRTGRYLWNSGIFLFPVGTLLSAADEHLHEVVAQVDKARENGQRGENILQLNRDDFTQVVPVSIDVGVMERVRSETYPYDGDWSDLGTWDAVREQLGKREQGKTATEGNVQLYDVRESVVFGDGSRLVVAGNLQNVAVIDTPDVLYIGGLDKQSGDSGSFLRDIVADLAENNFEEANHSATEVRPWGEFASVYQQERCKIKRITVDPGQRLSLQSHKQRSEVWVVLRGQASVEVDSDEHQLSAGDSVRVPAGARHRVANTGTELLEFIEVQTGSYFGEDDIERYEDDYGRC